MALHPDITRKDDVSLALETAAGAMLLATRQQTGNAGSVTIPNADGTKTVMGADAGDTTVARFVGRVTPPNRPTGIQAESHMGTLFVAWDGTLDGGMDAAFLFTRITISYADVDGDHSVDLGDLRGKGSVGSTTLPAGTVVTVTARAYDDAHDDTGRSMPNVSAPSDPITVTIVDEAAQLKADVTADIKVVSDKADKAQGAADDAAAANTKLREDTAASLETVDTKVAGVRTDVDAVSEKAATLESGLDSANTKITSTSDKLTGLTTTVSNVSQTADSALSLSTQNHQDLTGFQTTVSQTYSTKDETLSQVNAVSQKADSLSATLSKDYQKTADSDAKYATQAALQATGSSISASVAETYATKSVVDQLKNIADNAIETWQGHGIPSMTGEPASEWATGELRKQHSGDMYYDLDTGYSYRFGSADGTTYEWSKIADSDITKAMQAAAAAQSTADKNTDAVSKLNTDIPVTYATKSEVKITTDGIKADVVEAKRIGQTGVDNSAALAVRADGIDATLSQQATNIDNNVKAIAQVNMRADSLSTSITQVSNKTDQALANAQELVVNGGFETGDLTGWKAVNASVVGYDQDNPHSGAWQARLGAGGTLTQTIRGLVSGRTYRCSYWQRGYTDMKSAMTVTFPGGSPITVATLTGVMTYTLVSGDVVVPNGAATMDVQLSCDTNYIRFDDISVKDITEAQAAKKAADDAQSTANAAVSQASSLQQDLSGFKTSVAQSYETKSDSTSKATTAQQNLDGFKQTVQATYLDKTNASNTYSTKAEVKATADQISSNLTSVGTTANSAMTKATDAQQNLDGFKNTVSGTYATKTALDTTNGNVTQAQKDATTALSQYTTLSQDVNGFKQTVDQKYETKEDSQSKNSTLSQSLTDFKTSVSQTYTKQTDFNTLSGSASKTFGFSGTLGKAQWGKIGTVTMKGAAQSAVIEIRTGSGWEGGSNQNARVQIMIKRGNNSTNYSKTYGISVYRENCQTLTVKAMAQSNDVCEIWVYFPWRYWTGNYTISGLYDSWDNASTSQDAEPTSGAPQDIAYRLNPEQLQSDVAETYATQSSVQQTSSQITQQVAATYATKDDVTSKYTSLQQTDSAFDARIGTAQSTAANAQSNAANAQNRAGVLETLIHSDANGVRVGKTVGGVYQGYSALVNANGSFDVLDPGGNTMSRVNSDGMQLLNPLTGSLMNANRMIFGGLSVIETNVLNTAHTNIPSGGGITPWTVFGSLMNPDGSLAQIMSPTGKLLCLLSVGAKVSATSGTVANGRDVLSIALNVNLTLEPQIGSTWDDHPNAVWNPVPAIVDLPNAGQSYYPEFRPFVGLLNVSPNTIYYTNFSLRSFHTTAGSHYAQCGYRSLVLLPIT
jgi:predicted  nucleic acid-binding Zn-ribbon protein